MELAVVGAHDLDAGLDVADDAVRVMEPVAGHGAGDNLENSETLKRPKC